MNGQTKATAMKAYMDKQKSKSNGSNKISEKVNKKQSLEKQLESGLDKLSFDEVKGLFDKEKDPEIREKLMNKLQEKDVIKYGKEIYGIDMKNVDYKGTFDDAVKNVTKANADKEYITETVYHGTNNTFEKFSYDHFGQTDSGDFGQGIYVTKSKQTAAKYGKDIKEVEIKYKNPLVLNNDNDFTNFYKRYGDEWGEAKSLYNSKQVAITIMNMGYDAVIDNVYGQTIIYNLDNTNIKK